MPWCENSDAENAGRVFDIWASLLRFGGLRLKRSRSERSDRARRPLGYLGFFDLVSSLRRSWRSTRKRFQPSTTSWWVKVVTVCQDTISSVVTKIIRALHFDHRLSLPRLKINIAALVRCPAMPNVERQKDAAFA